MTTLPQSRKGQPGIVLAVVLLAAYAINLDTTIVNVALPTLNRVLHAGTSSLQWVVDAYNLAFAALVLAGGSIGDRYGRRRALAVGLGGFGVTSALAALCSTTAELIAVRFAMGASAALIFPTTLAILTTTFPDRNRRAAAIGAWGAVTGIGVATGPIVGGFLLEHFWWGSVFAALIPVAALALIGTCLAVPAGRQPSRPPLDPAGFALSVLALGATVYTLIEAPGWGWGSARSVAGYVIAAVLVTAFGRWEWTRSHPMLDLRLFTNLRFSAASGAVTVAFFSLFGFIFLITQYMQQLRHYGALSTGVRILPVAASLAAASVLSPGLAVRIGNKAVVAGGLVVLAGAFLSIGLSSAGEAYWRIALQMVAMGLGLGATSSAATESIMGVVRPDQAGAGSAVNDATREVGGTLGVAVLGSVYATLYSGGLGSGSHLPASALAAARSSFGAAQAVVAHLPAATAAVAQPAVVGAFMSGLHAACVVAAGVCLAGSLAVGALLPARPGQLEGVPAPGLLGSRPEPAL